MWYVSHRYTTGTKRSATMKSSLPEGFFHRMNKSYTVIRTGYMTNHWKFSGKDESQVKPPGTCPNPELLFWKHQGSTGFQVWPV